MRRSRSQRLVLSDDQVHQLNTEFYGGFPLAELEYQVAANAAMLSAREELLHAFATNTPLGQLHIRADHCDPDQVRQSGAIGLLVLSQHIAETLLRLLLVHSRREPCTWVALAQMNGHGVVHDIAGQVLAGRLQGPKGNRELSEVVSEHLLASAVRTTPAPQDHDAVVANTAEWVRFAATIANDSHLYNAYKHGVTLSYRPPIPVILSHDDTEYDDSMDPAISYMRRPRADEGARALWVQDFEPLDSAQRGFACLFLVQLIANVLFIGAAERSVPSVADTVTRYPASVTPDSVARERESPFIMGFVPREYGVKRV